MKNKKSILIILFVIIITISSFTFWYYKSNVTKPSNLPVDKDEDINSSKIEKELINISTYAEILNYINRNVTTFMVLGKTGCPHCENYKPVLKSISSELNLDVFYVNIPEMDEEERSALWDSDIIIPGKCLSSETDSPIRNGFGTPLTLFFRDGHVYNCIRGYKNLDDLKSILNTMDIVK